MFGSVVPEQYYCFIGYCKKTCFLSKFQMELPKQVILFETDSPLCSIIWSCFLQRVYEFQQEQFFSINTIHHSLQIICLPCMSMLYSLELLQLVFDLVSLATYDSCTIKTLDQVVSMCCLIWDMIKQNELEVSSTCYWFPQCYVVLICKNINIKTRYLSQVHY